MCGIAGWYRRQDRAVARAVVEAQCAAIIRRGPDDQGIHVDGDLGFGMRRLAVVDVAGGHQPMVTADGRFHLVYNGEIYNHHALRAELEALGHRFRTRCDTEVVLEGYAAWGDGVWSRVSGMFAVALWDSVTRSLVLVRDHLGIKPLYWAQTDGGVAFASELKGLVAIPELEFIPDPVALDQYLAFGAVLAPLTIYTGVRRLEPGCLLRINADGAPIEERYWRLTRQVVAGLDEESWCEELRHRLLTTVGEHLESDVPLGAFLSGGMDSAAVVAAMRRAVGAGRPPTAFTIGFRTDDPEVRRAAAVARHLGIEHKVRQVEPADAAAVLPTIAASFDEPFADPSSVPTWLLSAFAREHVTVALSGDGGDELFAGYRRHQAERLAQRLGSWPGVLPLIGTIADGLPTLPLRRWKSARQRWRKVIADARLTPARRFASKQVLIPAVHRHQLLHAGLRAGVAQDHAESALAARVPADGQRDPLEILLDGDTGIWLPEVLLTKVDRVSMDRSLEVRVPLLDRRFAEWTATVPIDLKLRQGRGKWLLRKALEPWLPPGATQAPKTGFDPPLSAWIRGSLGDWLRTVWDQSGIAASGLIDPDAVDRLFAVHQSDQVDHTRPIFVLGMLALWWTRHCEVFARARRKSA